MANCEWVIENEIAQGVPQKDIALTYAAAVRAECAGRAVDWRRINTAILTKWSPKALDRIKGAAFKLVRETE